MINVEYDKKVFTRLSYNLLFMFTNDGHVKQSVSDQSDHLKEEVPLNEKTSGIANMSNREKNPLDPLKLLLSWPL